MGYPATLLLVDGTTVVVNDDDEFAAVVVSGDWAGFGFPLTLIDEDGEEIVVNDEEELDEALLDCAGFGEPGFEFGDLFCYDLTYPFSVTDLVTGDEITVNDSEEWFELQFGGPNGPISFEINYPITLIDIETGEETVVNDEVELDEALAACTGSGGPGGPDPEFGEFLCYDFVYPFSVADQITGDVTAFNDSDEWNDYLNAGGPNGPDSFEFVYPFSLSSVETGDEVTVNDEEELFEAIEECW